jgi:hypothetical protein
MYLDIGLIHSFSMHIDIDTTSDRMDARSCSLFPRVHVGARSPGCRPPVTAFRVSRTSLVLHNSFVSYAHSMCNTQSTFETFIRKYAIYKRRQVKHASEKLIKTLENHCKYT